MRPPTSDKSPARLGALRSGGQAGHQFRASVRAAYGGLRIEAWAPTRDGCIRQAVLGTVESFLDLESAHAVHTRLRRLTADRDDDLLVAVLEEVIYLLDTVGETPVDLRLRDVDGGVDVTFATTDASTLVQVGAVPKAVSLNELRFSQGRHGWRCAVTLDV